MLAVVLRRGALVWPARRHTGLCFAEVPGAGEGAAPKKTPAAVEDASLKGAAAAASPAGAAAGKQGQVQAPENPLGAILMARQWIQLWALMPFRKLLDLLMLIPAWASRSRLKALREAAEAEPQNAEAQLAYLVELNKKAPEEVVKHMQSGEYATSPRVAKEYMKALVNSGMLDEYVTEDDGKNGNLATDSHHRSLPTLLQQLQDATASKGIDVSAGDSARRPIHVVVDSGRLGAAKGGPLQTFLSWSFTCLAFSLLWLIGTTMARRYGAMTAAGGAIGSPGPGAGAGAGSASSHAPKEYNRESMPEKSIKSFKDVHGCDESKAELEEVVQYLKTPEKFTKLGGKLPKGILLTGPPGTGKTLLARAVAGEAGVPFFYRAGSEFEEMFVGVGSRRVRSLFAAAKKKAPCIVFIDEIDAVGGSRKQWESTTRKTLNQMLVEMDGFESNEGIIVMAATNLPETLDPALTRPGRFDRHVAVPMPDVSGRLAILQHYMKDKPMSPEVETEKIARNTPGFSGAQLFNLINEAALIAAKGNKDSITPSMLDEARDKILMGVARTSLVQTEEARKLTAYHEGGHALVAMQTKGANPIHKATIVPRGHALGMVSQLPDKDEFSITREQMLASIDVAMGGKVAEELIFGVDKVTSGATSDLRQATRMARHMVADCGMSDEIGPMHVEALLGNGRGGSGSELWGRVDSEVQRVLREAYDRVKTLLTTNQEQLHKLAAALLEHETLTAKDIEEVLDGTFPAKASPGGGGAPTDSEEVTAIPEGEGGDDPIPAPATAATVSAAAAVSAPADE